MGPEHSPPTTVSSPLSLTFRLRADSKSRHLVLVKPAVHLTDDGINIRGRSKQGIRSTNGLRLTILALAEFKYRRQKHFDTKDAGWKKLRDRVRKQRDFLADPSRGDAAQWAEAAFGSIHNFVSLFKLNNGQLEVNQSVVSEASLKFVVEDDRTLSDEETLSFIRNSARESTSRARNSKPVHLVEPDDELRDAIIAFATKTLDISGISPNQKLILGKLIWYVRLRDLMDDLNYGLLRPGSGVFDNILDELKLEDLNSQKDAMEVSWQVAYAVRICKRAAEYAKLMNVELDRTTTALKLIQRSLAQDEIKKETLIEEVEQAQEACDETVNALDLRLRECRDTLRKYLLESQLPGDKHR